MNIISLSNKKASAINIISLSNKFMYYYCKVWNYMHVMKTLTAEQAMGREVQRVDGEDRE